MAKSRNDYNQEYYKRNGDKIRERKRIDMQRYRQQNPSKHRSQSRQNKRALKEAIFELYGNECCLCGYSDKRALSLDHILNNGAEERLALGERGVYRRARDSFLPNEYRILCMNCQFIARVESARQNQHKATVPEVHQMDLFG